MPWDSDIDVQMSASTVRFLASYYNMSIHTYENRDYMLEINPKYTDGSFKDRLNVIDGRWIDVWTGLFIDITAVRPKPKASTVFTSKANYQGVFASKDKHEEKVWDLFPLRDSLFEGLPVKIPYNYAKLLRDEYGNSALTKTEYLKHKFNHVTLLWEKVKLPKNGTLDDESTGD
ncbi:uncharacterized protein KY384_001482 [Bacidia gigantensis]|uniref:uncharacterized protein n=1 Tax=Bacidia gigantensis TaxID=2732470 RepID=UPI001D0415A7|nr:uncharacterized protein KY384_001482 [Bacidia gigantensis]KAG8533741.1 hypothetical protein KY384_001482 [Bacidia gigantensis]